MKKSQLKIAAICLYAAAPPVLSESEKHLEEVTVTSTRVARNVKDVAESISVIGSERIGQARMFNIADAISGTPGVNITSKSGGYDTRLIIRGGGLKANYGIREIFLMRDGIPITDPDSFSKLDYIDTQDIARIEITKGPGNIYATGSTAGVVHIISHPVFSADNNHLGIAGGTEGSENYSMRLSQADASGSHAFALSGSYRKDNNDWRLNNNFESSQVNLKFGKRWSEKQDLNIELGYTDANLDLPGDMTEEQFQQYLDSGEQRDSNSPFKHRGRYSETLMANIRYRTELGEKWGFNPRLYYTHWSQFHPVVPLITTAPGVNTLGTDLEFTFDQSFGGLVTGVTYRSENNDENKKYEYGDVNTLPNGRIISTNSNAQGMLAEQSSSESTAGGFFIQQNIDYFKNWLIDMSLRLDQISIDQQIERYREFNWARGVYQDVSGEQAQQTIDETFNLVSRRLGLSYSISRAWSIFANYGGGEQVPFASELEENPDLRESKVDSVELGAKSRNERWDIDLSAYSMAVEDEIIAILDSNGQTEFQNAGETDKLGFELAANVNLLESADKGAIWAGINYTYSDYKFKDFQEVVTTYGHNGAQVSEVERSGNQLPFIPQHYYSLSLNYQHISGLSLRLQSDTWGEYYVDNANTEKYEGYSWLSSLNIRYEFLNNHQLSINIANLDDQRYASVVKKDVGREKAYTPGAPRSWLLAYRYNF